MSLLFVPALIYFAGLGMIVAKVNRSGWAGVRAVVFWTFVLAVAVIGGSHAKLW